MLWKDRSDKVFVIPFLLDQSLNERINKRGIEADMYDFGFALFEMITGKILTRELSHDMDRAKIQNNTVLT